MPEVKILKVIIAVEGEPHIFECAAIEHEAPCGSSPIGGQTRDLPASDAILLRVMWPSTPAGRQHLA